MLKKFTVKTADGQVARIIQVHPDDMELQCDSSQGETIAAFKAADAKALKTRIESDRQAVVALKTARLIAQPTTEVMLELLRQKGISIQNEDLTRAAASVIARR